MQRKEQRAARALAMSAVMAAGFASATTASAADTVPKPAYIADKAAACAALRPSLNFSQTTDYLARILDAPATVITAKILPPERGMPEICRIEGQIAPTIGFVMKLPTQNWNGKMLMGGCGGPCGIIPNDKFEPALVRNYAVIVTDMGHKGVGYSFAYNNLQGVIDYGSRATHVTAVVGKELVDIYYGTQPKQSYFYGCSTGGRQAMVAAQRFPEDFTGIVGGAPPYNQIGDTPYFLVWGARANVGPDGKPILDAAKLPMIHKAVMDSCATKSDKAIGVLQNPLACKWDPGEIVCKSGGADASCLSTAEADVVRKIYTGAVNSKGRKLYFGMPRGSELGWAPSFVNTGGKHGDYLSGFGGAGNSQMMYGSLMYSPGPTWKETDFDYDKHPNRLGVMAAFYNATNPDLREFKAAGGKLILFHGWDDNQIPAEASIDYYETATRTMGGPAQTKDFFRLFMQPGANHCRTGQGGGDLDWLTALENWVEKGQAPDKIIAYKLKEEPYPMVTNAAGETYVALPRHPLPEEAIERSRPIYAYPDLARWTGKGDPMKAENWVKASR
jgi:hypothetical protein